MTDALPCRTCFWAAELTRVKPEVWCSHKTYNGWQIDKPGCDGKAFRPDDDRPRSRP